MKKVSTSLLKNINWLLGGLLALLGFTTCDGGADMYGCPHAKFTIKGKVINEAQIPIPQIQIRTAYTDSPNYVDTLYTDSKGEFIYTKDNKYISLFFTDIDGNANGGNYAPDSTSVSFKDMKLEGGDGDWYLGEATKEITIVLKEKEAETKTNK